MARARGLVWAMEELEEQLASVEAEEPMAVDSMETDMLEVSEQAAEIDDTNTAIEEAVEDVDTLEDIASVMDESTENGGMDQVSARVAEVAVESIYARLGVRKSKPMPVMESFGSKGTRLTATKIALEKIEDGIKYVWEKIKSAAEKVWGWIKSFLAAIFNTAGKLKERAVALAAKVKGLVGKKAEGKVDLGSVGEKAAVDGKADYPHLMIGLKNATELAEASQANAETISKDMVDPTLVTASENEENLAKLKTEDVSLKGFEKVDGGEEGMQTLESGQLPGGAAVSVEVPKAGLTGKEALAAKGRSKVDKYSKMKKGPKVSKEELSEVTDVKYEMVAATPEQLGEVCEKVSILAKFLEAAKSGLGKVSSAASTFLGMIKNIGTKIVNAAKDVAALFQKAFSAVSRVVSGFFSKVYGAIVNSGKACLDWVEKHYQAYSAKKANKENGITELKAA